MSKFRDAKRFKILKDRFWSLYFYSNMYHKNPRVFISFKKKLVFVGIAYVSHISYIHLPFAHRPAFSMTLCNVRRTSPEPPNKFVFFFPFLFSLEREHCQKRFKILFVGWDPRGVGSGIPRFSMTTLLAAEWSFRLYDSVAFAKRAIN